VSECDFSARALPGVRALTPYQPGKPESELRRELGLDTIVKLASNENPLGPSSAAVAAGRAAVERAARYPDGNGFELKAALSEHLGVERECLTLGNGSNDILELIARCFAGPGDEIVYARHSFAVYALATQAVGATARIAEANPGDHAQPYGHDLEAMTALVGPRTKVIFVANPNNPTGTWSDAGALAAFLDGVPENVVVVVDEAYTEYVDRPDYASVLAEAGKRRNLLVTRTFSKAYGLAGLRVGFSVSDPQIADLLNRVRQPFNVNEVAQASAVAALADQDHIERSRALNAQELRRLERAFGSMGLSYLPSAGNFICVNVRGSGQAVFEDLLREGVIVRPVANYGLQDFLRITIGLEQENDFLLAVMGRVLVD